MAYANGHAKCTTSGTLITNGTRSFHASISAPVSGDQGASGGHSNQTGFDGLPDTLVTVKFYTYESGGTTTTPNADNITIAVYDANGGLVKTLASAVTPPANGTGYSFYYTANGNSGGGDRCGQLEVRITAVRTSGTAGLDNYNVNSSTQAHQGMIRANQKVSIISAASSQDGVGPHYYGAGGNNTLTVTVTHTQQFVVNGSQTFKKQILTAADAEFLDAGTSTIGTGTTTTFTDVVDVAYPNSSASYGARWQVVGNGPLETNEPWALPVDDGNPVQDGTTAVKRSAFFTVDPGVTNTAPTLSKALHNRGFTTTIDIGLQNAGGASLTRSIPFRLRDNTATIRSSPSDTGPNYDINYTIGSGDGATFDFIGGQWTLDTNQGDMHNITGINVYKVSRKLRLGSAAGLNDLAVTTDKEKYVRGFSPSISYYLSEADGTPLASKSVNTRVHDDTTPTSNEEDVQVVATTAGGLVSYSYLIGDGDKASFDETGSPKHIETDWSGNSTDDSAGEWAVGYRLRIPNYVDPDNAGDFWTGKTDLDADANGDPDGTDETDFFVGADVAYGKVRIIDINGDDYDDADITMWLLRNAVISQGPKTGSVSQTESGYTGWQDLFYQFDVKAPAGGRVFRMEAAKDGNTTGNVSTGGYLTKNVNYAPSYTGNLYIEVNYEPHDLTVDELRFTVSPIIFATNNDRQQIEDVSPVATVDIDPQYHYTVYNPAGAPTYSGAQVPMTRISIGNDNHFEATITGLSSLVGKTIHVHVVLTVNGGQLQGWFPVNVGAFNPTKVESTFDGVDFITGFPYK